MTQETNEPSEREGARRDGLAAVAMLLLTVGLVVIVVIALI